LANAKEHFRELKSHVDDAEIRASEAEIRAANAEETARQLKAENIHIRAMLDAFRPKVRKLHERTCPDCGHPVKIDDDDMSIMFHAEDHGKHLPDWKPGEATRVFLRVRCARKDSHE
jgi:hypothetical protein